MRRERRQRRITFMISFFVVAVGLLIGRIFYIQMVKGSEYAAGAVAQRAGTYVYDSGRGEILDRSGDSLHAENETVSADLQQELAVYDVPVGLIDSLSDLEKEIRYTANSLASHVTGYINVPKNPMIPQDGISGLERLFNEELQGAPSAVGVILDAKGKMVPGFGIMHWQYEHFRRPYNVITTIDRRLQEIVETKGAQIQKGAVILLEPQSGDILAMASFPRLPVEKLYSGMTSEDLKQLENNSPYLNRAVRQYPTGSVFKVILTAAALEQNLPEPEGLFICDGSYELGNATFHCYENWPHGVMDLHAALAESCNGYFIDLALRLGKQTVVEMANRFKLGQATGIALGGEMSGNIPALSDLHYGGDVANMAIGQGKVAATPLQLGRMMCIIANHGRDVYPRLVSGIVDKNGNTVKSYPVQYGSRILPPTITDQLQQLLTTVVKNGTAKHAYSPLYEAYGKSGTAEVADANYSHSWFAAGVNTGKRTLAAVVFIEEWRKGNDTASKVFRTIMEAVVAAEADR